MSDSQLVYEPIDRVEVLNELVKGAVTWQLQRGADRGRMVIIGIVPPSTEATTIEALTEAELRTLLAPVPTPTFAGWKCSECGTVNDASRRWCRVCSDHGSASA